MYKTATGIKLINLWTSHCMRSPIASQTQRIPAIQKGKATFQSPLPGRYFGTQHLAGLQNAWKTKHSGPKTIVFFYKTVPLVKLSHLCTNHLMRTQINALHWKLLISQAQTQIMWTIRRKCDVPEYLTRRLLCPAAPLRAAKCWENGAVCCKKELFLSHITKRSCKCMTHVYITIRWRVVWYEETPSYVSGQDTRG